MNDQERKPTLGETTLEDYLVKAGLFSADASLGHTMSLDNPTAVQNFVPPIGLSPSPSIDALSDTPFSGRKRDATDIDKTLDRRLRRKIKNRESAARSRARKQAYQNELVNKVSQLEEENMKLKKEKASKCSPRLIPWGYLLPTTSTVLCIFVHQCLDKWGFVKILPQ